MTCTSTGLEKLIRHFPLSLKSSKCWSMLKKVHVGNKKAIDTPAVPSEQLSNKEA